ncbi:replication initiation protein [Planococcus sp. 1R117A]|uniref:replication initiation protein n=1 Tax=Planococcus sp. 1R117A TaxID=3447020 RepID=UPI003EDBE87B
MKSKYLVTQSNNLLEARHNNPLTTREQKIVLTMASMIEPFDEDFKDYRISLKEFSEMLGLAGSTKYSEIKEISKTLMSKTIEIPQEDGGWLLVHWISSAKYVNGEGVLELSFSPKLKPYMLQLKKQFTSYRLSNILSLNSTYSIRLYELMKKWQQLKRWEISLEELKMKLGVIEGSYNRYNHFKTRVLLKAVNEVNEKTDLSIVIKEIKKGRSVERIEFTIQRAAEKESLLPVPDEELDQLKVEEMRIRLNALAVDYQFDVVYFSQLYEGAYLIWKEDVEKELELLIRYINEDKTIKNPLGFIKTKIRDAWKIYQAGGNITFADLQVVKHRGIQREELLPDWFTMPDETPLPEEVQPDSEPSIDFLKEKEEVLEKLAKKKRKS